MGQMSEHASNPKLFIPFSLLPEGRLWSVGKAYRVKVVLRQTSTSEDGADFEVVDATSLEGGDAERRRFFVSEGGMLKA